jgi:predicted MFS family arabinose efflux permease
MSNKRIIYNSFLLYFVLFSGFALTFTQIIPFLTYVGYTPIERGIILSGTAIVSMIGQFAVGYLCDKYNTTKRFYNVLTMLYVIFVALMYTYSQQIFFIHLILVSLGGGLFRIVAGLLETWTIETNNYMKSHFGAIRAFGAIGWAVGAPLTSFIINEFGYRYIGLAFGSIILVSHAVSYWLPDAHKEEENTNLKLKDIHVLLKNSNYIIVLITLVFVNIIFTADMYLVIDKIISIGGNNDQIAFKWSFQAVSELPLFFLGYFFLKKFGAKKLLLFSISMLMIRFSLYTLATSPTQIILISGMQSITFPFLAISQKVIISNESPSNLQSTGQMFGLSMYVGFPALITPILSGFLVENFGYNFALFIMTISLIIPLLLTIYYTRKTSIQ